MLNLNDREWKGIPLSSVFLIKSAKCKIHKINLNNENGIYPYVTRTERNNGIESFVCKQEGHEINEGRCITVGLDTQTAFYQPYGFYTGQSIHILRNDKLNRLNALFILPNLRITLSAFSWGSYGATLARLRRSKVMLPLGNGGSPDWQFMEQYIREREQSQLAQYIAHLKGDRQ